MNYTKTIREYCLKNTGSLFDVSILKDTHFPMIPYKTLLKILNRLEEEKIIKKIAKGVYLIDDGRLLGEIVFEEYLGGLSGMYVGYTMYNNDGISTYKDDTVEIYTNRLHTRHKKIDKYLFTYVGIPFTTEVRNLIRALELIQKGYTIKERDDEAYTLVMLSSLVHYSDLNFTMINDVIKYNYSTIAALSRKLQQCSIENKCLEIYNRKYPVQ